MLVRKYLVWYFDNKKYVSLKVIWSHLLDYMLYLSCIYTFSFWKQWQKIQPNKNVWYISNILLCWSMFYVTNRYQFLIYDIYVWFSLHPYLWKPHSVMSVFCRLLTCLWSTFIDLLFIWLKIEDVFVLKAQFDNW